MENLSESNNNQISIKRGCLESSDSNNVMDVSDIHQDVWVCSGDNCNKDEELDLPPYDLLPVEKNRWTKPLSLDEAHHLCNDIECIECLTCMHIYNVGEGRGRQGDLS